MSNRINHTFRLVFPEGITQIGLGAWVTGNCTAEEIAEFNAAVARIAAANNQLIAEGKMTISTSNVPANDIGHIWQDLDAYSNRPDQDSIWQSYWQRYLTATGATLVENTTTIIE
jgi:hypothetical protein